MGAFEMFIFMPSQHMKYFQRLRFIYFFGGVFSMYLSHSVSLETELSSMHILTLMAS